jgi:hypothetical protein
MATILETALIKELERKGIRCRELHAVFVPGARRLAYKEPVWIVLDGVTGVVLTKGNVAAFVAWFTAEEGRLQIRFNLAGDAKRIAREIQVFRSCRLDRLRLLVEHTVRSLLTDRSAWIDVDPNQLSSIDDVRLRRRLAHLYSKKENVDGERRQDSGSGPA